MFLGIITALDEKRIYIPIKMFEEFIEVSPFFTKKDISLIPKDSFVFVGYVEDDNGVTTNIFVRDYENEYIINRNGDKLAKINF